MTNQSLELLQDSSSDLCALAQAVHYKSYDVCLLTLISDEFGTLIVRRTGFNNIRTLAVRLSYYYATQNSLLSYLLLQLTLRGKNTTQSYRQPVYYVDLTLREGVDLQSAIHTAREIDQQSKQSGFNQEALDQMARQGFANAKFEMDIEEGLDVVEEFYQGEQERRSEVQNDTFNIQQGLKGSVSVLN